MTNEVRLTEEAIREWIEDVGPRAELDARAVALMRAGLPNAELREASGYMMSALANMADRSTMTGSMVIAECELRRALAAVPEPVPTAHYDALLGERDRLAAEVGRLPAQQAASKSPGTNAFALAEYWQSQYKAACDQRDEAQALLADLQASNLAMQADRDELHKRIEGLKADFDEAIQQRDEAIKRAEAAEKAVREVTDGLVTARTIFDGVVEKDRDTWKDRAEWLLAEIKGGAS